MSSPSSSDKTRAPFIPPKLTLDQKTMTILCLVIEEIGAPKRWRLDRQWQAIANNLWACQDRTGYQLTAEEIKKRFSAIFIMRRFSKSDLLLETIILRLIIEEIGEPWKWTEGSEWTKIADRLWVADGNQGNRPPLTYVRRNFATAMKRGMFETNKTSAGTEPPYDSLSKRKSKKAIAESIEKMVAAGLVHRAKVAVTPGSVKKSKPLAQPVIETQDQFEKEGTIITQDIQDGASSEMFNDSGYSEGLEYNQEDDYTEARRMRKELYESMGENWYT